MNPFHSAAVRKSIYLASAPISAALVILGVQESAAVAYVGAALAVANILLAVANVPGDDDGNGIPDDFEAR